MTSDASYRLATQLLVRRLGMHLRVGRVPRTPVPTDVNPLV